MSEENVDSEVDAVCVNNFIKLCNYLSGSFAFRI
jgi:hypothetical protein